MTILNANEYITKGEAVQVLHTAYAEGRIQAKDGCASVLDDIGALKAADVQPKKFGHWIGNPYMLNRQKCSECGFWQDDLQADNFCPSCGADMRGEQN